MAESKKEITKLAQREYLGRHAPFSYNTTIIDIPLHYYYYCRSLIILLLLPLLYNTTIIAISL